MQVLLKYGLANNWDLEGPFPDIATGYYSKNIYIYFYVGDFLENQSLEGILQRSGRGSRPFLQ